jgi:hypothetical protein
MKRGMSGSACLERFEDADRPVDAAASRVRAFR